MAALAGLTSSTNLIKVLFGLIVAPLTQLNNQLLYIVQGIYPEALKIRKFNQNFTNKSITDVKKQSPYICPAVLFFSC